MSRYLFLGVGVVSVLVLAAIIFMRPGSFIEDSVEEIEPTEALELYITDKMDYSIKFSRILVERRIRSADSIAAAYPELAQHAREVADSLRSRLARSAPQE